MAYDKPNYTQAPNLLFDKHLPEITALSELKVTLIVLRNTIGWHEKEVVMDIPFLIGATGMGRQSVVDGIKMATERGTVRRRRIGHSFAYEANITRVQKVDSLTVQISDRNVDCCDEEALLEKERNTHAREDDQESEQPMPPVPAHSRRISGRPEPQRRPARRKQAKAADQVWTLPEGWRPEADPIIAMIRDELKLKVPRATLKVAVDDYIYSRTGDDAKPIKCEPQRDCENFIRIYARNHWSRTHRPEQIEDPYNPNSHWVPPEYHWSMNKGDAEQFKKDYEM